MEVRCPNNLCDAEDECPLRDLTAMADPRDERRGFDQYGWPEASGASSSMSAR